MKKLLPFLSLIILASCGESGDSSNSEPDNILENLSYSVDTVVVDTGDDFLAIASEFQLESSSSFSEEGNLLYIFFNKDHRLALVDLDQLKLIEFLSFEKEGPNGVGEYIQGVQALPGEKFLFTTFQSAVKVDRQGKMQENYKLFAEEFDGLDISSPFSSQLRMTADGKWMFSLTGFFNQGAKDLVKLDPVQRSGESIDLQAFDMADNFSINLQSNQGSMTSVPQSNIQEINGALYILNEVTSSIYRYRYSEDSLELITFQHELVANEKIGSLTKNVTSREEFMSEMTKSSTQVGFKKLLWDESKELFFRLGSKIIPTSIEGEEVYKSEVYLFAYDIDLNLKGETQLQNLSSPPRFYFMKDGKLWAYVNVDDELGFAVFTFDL